MTYREARAEDHRLAGGVRQASVRVVVACGAGHARVAGGDDEADALQAELHELVALPLLVRGRRVGLLAAVRDRDDVRRLVDAALEVALVSCFSAQVRSVTGVAHAYSQS